MAFHHKERQACHQLEDHLQAAHRGEDVVEEGRLEVAEDLHLEVAEDLNPEEEEEEVVETQ